MLNLFLVLLSAFLVSSEHVIVVGGGAAGLATVRDLTNRGLQVTLLEGSNRLGGRGYTIKSPKNNSIDMGCQWFGGNKQNPLYPFVAANKWVLPKEEETVYIYRNGTHLSKPIVKLLSADFDKVYARVAYYQKVLTHDQPLNETILQAYQDVKSSLKSQMKTDIGYLWFMYSNFVDMEYLAEFHQLSSLYYDDDDYIGGVTGYIENGYGTLIAAGLKPANAVVVNYSSVVTQVDYTSDSKVIATLSNSKKVEADAIVITVSLGVLQKGSITFSPPLPNQFTTSLNNRGMGLIEKYVLIFEGEKFWGKKDQYFYVATSFVQFYSPTYLKNEAIMFAFIANDDVINRQHLSEEEIVKELLVELKEKIFVNIQQLPKLTQFYSKRWDLDPLYLGAWSYNKLGCDPTVDFKNLFKVTDRVHFAGEHTHRQHFGWVNGAIYSGLRASRALSSLFKWKYCQQITSYPKCITRCQWKNNKCRPKN